MAYINIRMGFERENKKKKKCLDPNLQKYWSKIDLSLSLGSNNACITSKLIFFPNIIEN